MESTDSLTIEGISHERLVFNAGVSDEAFQRVLSSGPNKVGTISWKRFPDGEHDIKPVAVADRECIIVGDPSTDEGLMRLFLGGNLLFDEHAFRLTIVIPEPVKTSARSKDAFNKRVITEVLAKIPQTAYGNELAYLPEEVDAVPYLVRDGLKVKRRKTSRPALELFATAPALHALWHGRLPVPATVASGHRPLRPRHGAKESDG